MDRSKAARSKAVARPPGCPRQKNQTQFAGCQQLSNNHPRMNRSRPANVEVIGTESGEVSEEV